MAKGMTKAQIIAHLAEKTELNKKHASRFLDELSALAYREAPNGFTLPGLGKLVLVERSARMGRNPKTGEPIQIPAKRTLKFRVAKEAKEAAAKMTVEKTTAVETTAAETTAAVSAAAETAA